MKLLKNGLIIVIVIMMICILVLIGLEPVVIDALNQENTLVDEDKNIIDLGVVPKTNSSSVKISNNNVYINNGGVYEVSGILYNGTIYIDTKEDVTLNFDEVTIVNENTSVIDNRKSSKVIINLEEDTNNIFSDGINSQAAIKSVGDIFLEGSGSMLIYANNEAGIKTSGGNLVLNGINLYVIAQGSAFDVSKEFLVNSGVVLGFGNGGMQATSNLSKQNTLLFNFTDTLAEGTALSLKNAKDENMINFIGLRDFKTLTLSLPDLDKGRYFLYQDITCDARLKNGIYNDCEVSDGEQVKISITDTFLVSDKWNWYGSMDIIINYIPEITT